MLRIEGLESREVMTVGGPTAEMQEMLEITNFARQHPAEAAHWATSDMQTDSLGHPEELQHGRQPARNDIASKPVVQPLAGTTSSAGREYPQPLPGQDRPADPYAAGASSRTARSWA